MYLNKQTLENMKCRHPSLTITWDVFEFYQIRSLDIPSLGLTITWDVFEFFDSVEKVQRALGLTITWDVFELAFAILASIKASV